MGIILSPISLDRKLVVNTPGHYLLGNAQTVGQGGQSVRPTLIIVHIGAVVLYANQSAQVSAMQSRHIQQTPAWES